MRVKGEAAPAVPADDVPLRPDRVRPALAALL